ncbi:MFS transporter [Actinoplanes sp. TBRC 11911]|uniref:MFS transporter n=1 Tax=Actinoplanes sp. TBRC 11911 TaxID=2729386 RepID=UPI00249E4BA3|nr:MFS transporter [Actinoplanes sp. TBRC 11911]
MAYGIWGGVSGAAAAIGPVLGGVLTDGLGWRWIFLVNLPVSVAALVLCKVALRPDGPRRSGRFDIAGTVSFTVAAAALTCALIRANEVGWSSPRTWGLLLLSAVALVAFGQIERRSPYAMLDLSLLRRRSFAGILIASLLVNFAAFAVLVYTSIWLQALLGLTPLRAGLTALPVGVIALVASAVAGGRLHGRSPRVIIGTGMLLIGVGSLLGAVLVGPGSGWPALVPGYAVVGLGVGLVMPMLASSGMAAVPADRGGMAAGTLNTARQLGFAVGVAVLGTVVASRAGSVLGDQAAGRAVAAGQAHGPAFLGAAAAGLDAGFLVAGGVGLIGAVAVFALVRHAGPDKNTTDVGQDAAGADQRAAGADADSIDAGPTGITPARGPGRPRPGTATV